MNSRRYGGSCRRVVEPRLRAVRSENTCIKRTRARADHDASGEIISCIFLELNDLTELVQFDPSDRRIQFGNFIRRSRIPIHNLGFPRICDRGSGEQALRIEGRHFLESEPNLVTFRRVVRVLNRDRYGFDPRFGVQIPGDVHINRRLRRHRHPGRHEQI